MKLKKNVCVCVYIYIYIYNKGKKKKNPPMLLEKRKETIWKYTRALCSVF